MKHNLKIALLVPAYDGSDDDAAEMLKELRKSFEAMQEGVKTNGEAGAEALQKCNEMNDKLDKYEDANQKLVAKLESEKAAKAELEERIEGIEKRQSRMRSNGGQSIEKAEALAMEHKSLLEYARTTESNLKEWASSDLNRKYLRSDNNPNGGFLMDTSYDNDIIKPLTEISPMRNLARIRRIDALKDMTTTRTSLVKTYGHKEGVGIFIQDNSTYDSGEIPVNSVTTEVEITNEALFGSRFDMENEIMSDMRESRAKYEGLLFTIGSGANEAQGFLGRDDVNKYESSVSGTFNADDLISMSGQLKTGYSPLYAMNRRTAALCRTLKDGAGNYVFQHGNLASGLPNQINGYSYVEYPDMPDVGALNIPIAFADWRRFYTIVDSFQAIFLRDPYTVRGSVSMSIQSWVGGDVRLAEAGVLLRCAA